MKDHFDPTLADDIKQRIIRLHLESERRWGTMTVAQPPAHCMSGIQMATADAADGRCSIAIPPREKRSSRRIASSSICCLADTPAISGRATGYWPKAPSSPLPAFNEFASGVMWWRRVGSNHRPTGYESVALTI
jgi:hypothetical protein